MSFRTSNGIGRKYVQTQVSGFPSNSHMINITWSLYKMAPPGENGAVQPTENPVPPSQVSVKQSDNLFICDLNSRVLL